MSAIDMAGKVKSRGSKVEGRVSGADGRVEVDSWWLIVAVKPPTSPARGNARPARKSFEPLPRLMRFDVVWIVGNMHVLRPAVGNWELRVCERRARVRARLGSAEAGAVPVQKFMVHFEFYLDLKRDEKLTVMF
jgi:hypothetical protein